MNQENRRPKVLMIACTGPSPEHPHQAVFVRRWAEQLVEAGCDVRVFTRRHITLGTYLTSLSRVREYFATPRQFRYDWGGIPVTGIRLHFRFPLNYSPSAVHLSIHAMRAPLVNLYNEFPFDLMYMATWGDFSLAAAKVAAELGIPYLATAIGGYENRYYNKPMSLPYRIQRELYEGSKLVLCVSEDIERKAQIMTDGRVPTWTWDSGVDMQHFSPSLTCRKQRRTEIGIGENDLLFSFVGRLTKQKGISDLLSAFCELAKEQPRVKLLLVGHGRMERSIRQQLHCAGLETRVSLTGGVPADDIVNYLNASDIFVFPSWHEGLPNVVKEASACALPIIASNVGGIPEIIGDGQNGILVPPRNRGALLAAMRRLASDSDLRAKLGHAARKDVGLKYDYHTNGHLLVEKIRSIVDHD